MEQTSNISGFQKRYPNWINAKGNEGERMNEWKLLPILSKTEKTTTTTTV